MPGFVINGAGGDVAAQTQNKPANTTEIRRKHRWIFQTFGAAAHVNNIILFLQSASRPNFSFEEPEMHHNEEVVRYAGKRSWEPITLVWYDAEQGPDASSQVFLWIDGTSGGQVSTIPQANTNLPSQYKVDANLQMLTGLGTPTETWKLLGCWPQSINWGDLDYSSTDLQTIEVVMRFDRAVRG